MLCLRLISLFGEPNHLFADLRKHLPLIKVLEAPLAPSSAFIVEDWATSRQDASDVFLISGLTQVLQNGSGRTVSSQTLGLLCETELVFSA